MKMVPLGEITNSVQRTNPASNTDDTFTYIDLSTVDSQSKTIGTAGLVAAKDAPSRARQIVHKDDVLVSTVRPNLNAVAIVPEEYSSSIASTGFSVLRTEVKRLCPRYLFHWVRSNQFVRQMVSQSTGANYPAVTDRTVRASCIPLPPLDEQRRFAAILDKADAIRQKRRQAAAHLDTLTQSVLEDFSQMRSQGFKSFHFDDIVDSISTGRSPNCEARPAETGEWGILKLSAVTTGTFRPRENKAFTGDPQLISKYEIHDGDLMMTRKNTPDLVGAVSIAHAPPPRLAIPDIVFRIAPNPELANNIYLHALLMSPNVRSQVKSLAGGSAKSMSNISATRLKALELQLPSLESQEAFSTAVQRIQLIRNRHQASFDLEHNLFASLQSRAFRGEL